MRNLEGRRVIVLKLIPPVGSLERCVFIQFSFTYIWFYASYWIIHIFLRRPHQNNTPMMDGIHFSISLSREIYKCIMLPYTFSIYFRTRGNRLNQCFHLTAKIFCNKICFDCINLNFSQNMLILTVSFGLC